MNVDFFQDFAMLEYINLILKNINAVIKKFLGIVQYTYFVGLLNIYFLFVTSNFVGCGGSN